MNPAYELIRTQRKTIQISIDRTGGVTVRAPRRVSRGEIEQFVTRKADWITKHIAAQQKRYENCRVLTEEETLALRQAAARELPALTESWAKTMGVVCTGVRITAAARRWGSCAPRGSICYSFRVMLLPPALRTYIVVHELAHLRVRSHAPEFYAEVARWLPDYRARIAALRAFERDNPIVTEAKE